MKINEIKEKNMTTISKKDFEKAALIIENGIIIKNRYGLVGDNIKNKIIIIDKNNINKL